ncbi:acetyltransferase [Dehalococcoides mccartyi]|jgi:ribosomal-protein-alanine N-acetyltransferase|uniref:GNAT family N-acetyltransferase n=1 Tax=Dehalococcoides mccartyi TaxID=61435 RepID=UPI0004E055DD|nr:GNAT family protein [Dehalococcoides mccartyi]AII57481.1 acetyltransferase [Dehalococcoides mccartyi CG1]APH11978.1 acetyltransferase [Dehalococcoides mccartyi]
MPNIFEATTGQGFKQAILESQSLRLRIIQAADAYTAFNLIKDPEIIRYLVWDGPKTINELRLAYQEETSDFETGRRYSFAIERVDKPGLIGSLAFRLIGYKEQALIGYWLGRKYWTKGYMTEAVRLSIHFAFKHLNAERVFGGIFKGNEPSRRTLEKNGFQLDGTLRRDILVRGTWIDVWFMSLLRQEWEENPERYTPQSEEVINAQIQTA